LSDRPGRLAGQAGGGTVPRGGEGERESGRQSLAVYVSMA
jgi:hypothetical protein